MKINYDKIADALYLSLKKGKIHKTVKMEDRLVVDVDKKGNILGVEFLEAYAQFGSNNKPVNLSVKIPAMSRV